MRDYKLSLNLITNNSVDSKRFKQYDTGNEIELEVFQNENLREEERLILTDEIVLAFFKRKDGQVLQKNCSIREGNIIVKTEKDVLGVPGPLELECLIKKDSIETTTQRITFQVDESIDRSGAIEDDPRYYADLVTDLLNIRDNIKEETQGEINEINSQLVEVVQQDLPLKANKSEVRNINTPITEYDISDTLKQQINGNAPILQTIADGIITPTKTSFIKPSLNKFNKNTVTIGYYVKYTNGVLDLNASYDASDYIEINPNLTYSYSGILNKHFAFFDANKVYISNVINTLSNPFTPPDTAKYVRLSILPANLETAYLNEGNTLLGYTKYEEVLLNKYIPKDTINVFLPSQIYVAVGRTIELYNNQVCWCGNMNNYHFKWDCTIGKAMKRKFTVTGTVLLIGEYTLALTVYDNNLEQVTSTSTTLKVVSNTINSGKSILTIGDSLTNEKPWLAEVRSLSSDLLTFVGTRGTTTNIKHEGRSGFSAGNYLTATAYTYENEGIHPFWDAENSRFNWTYYKTNTGINPDIIMIYLGTNGMDLDTTLNSNNIKKMVDHIRQDDANIPIYIVNTLYKGNQDGIGNKSTEDGYAGMKGQYKLEEDKKVYSLMTKLYELLRGYVNLHFIPIALTHDSEYNFGSVSTPVNPRANQMELLPIEAVHPQNQGYMQMADCIYSTICGTV